MSAILYIIQLSARKPDKHRSLRAPLRRNSIEDFSANTAEKGSQHVCFRRTATDVAKEPEQDLQTWSRSRVYMMCRLRSLWRLQTSNVGTGKKVRKLWSTQGGSTDTLVTEFPNQFAIAEPPLPKLLICHGHLEDLRLRQSPCNRQVIFLLCQTGDGLSTAASLKLSANMQHRSSLPEEML